MSTPYGAPAPGQFGGPPVYRAPTTTAKNKSTAPLATSVSARTKTRPNGGFQRVALTTVLFVTTIVVDGSCGVVCCGVVCCGVVCCGVGCCGEVCCGVVCCGVVCCGVVCCGVVCCGVVCCGVVCCGVVCCGVVCCCCLRRLGLCLSNR